jgi:hypothetical protein
VGKRKGRIDLDAKSDESSNDESEDDEDLTHPGLFHLSLTRPTLSPSLSGVEESKRER